MGKITKALIILMFLVAVGFLLFSAKIIGRVENQKVIIKSLEESIGSLEETIVSLSETINASKKRITELRGQITQLTRELTSTKAAKARVEQELAQVKNEKSRLQTALAEEERKVQSLTQEKTHLQAQVASLKEEKKELGENLQRKTRELEIAQEKLTKLESVGILLEKEITPPSEGKTPKIVKAIEGKVVDIKPGGVVAINFKGSIKPQEGTTFYVIHSDQIKARLVLKEIYNTIMIAQMTTEGRIQNINYGDLVRLVLWAEE